ncbi:MAG: CBS domain-containing protein, partial [Acidiferrobacterales bacterium]|nr:CBS domain-containing protein [Acidiferrobacterales bacterium]
MLVGEYCNRDVVIVEKGCSVREAAGLMRTQHVGDLIVIEERAGKRIPVGIITDRDIVLEVIAKDVDLDVVAVGDVMSFELTKASEEDEVLEAVKLMRAKGVRRVPVVGRQGALVGILAVDDLIELLQELVADIG